MAISPNKLTFVKGDTHGLPVRLKRLRATFQECISPAEEIGVWERLRKTQLVRAGHSGEYFPWVLKCPPKRKRQSDRE